jgi:hypothetical protein
MVFSFIPYKEIILSIPASLSLSVLSETEINGSFFMLLSKAF